MQLIWSHTKSRSFWIGSGHLIAVSKSECSIEVYVKFSRPENHVWLNYADNNQSGNRLIDDDVFKCMIQKMMNSSSAWEEEIGNCLSQLM